MKCVSYGCFREHDKKVCCLGLTALIPLPVDQLPGEALQRVFRATLDLLVAYKDQVAGRSMLLSFLPTFLYLCSLQVNVYESSSEIAKIFF